MSASNRAQVFIDGHAGSTGLRVHELLGARDDIELLTLPEHQRKDDAARRDALGAADVAILCLPDAAAGTAVEMIDASGARTRVIDASSARRTLPGWVYGLPELSAEQRSAIAAGDRVANPGCYPQTFVLALRPLVDAELLSPDAPYSVHGISGYSGGGRAMVERYRAAADTGEHLPIAIYGLDGGHKHLPEMARFAGIDRPPVFLPAVEHAFAGMLVSVPLPRAMCGDLDAATVHATWAARYADCPLVHVTAPHENAHSLDAHRMLPLAAGPGNGLALHVFDHGDAGLLLVGRLDNLAKGASGNAVQCLNLMLGMDERTSLI